MGTRRISLEERRKKILDLSSRLASDNPDGNIKEMNKELIQELSVAVATLIEETR